MIDSIAMVFDRAHIDTARVVARELEEATPRKDDPHGMWSEGVRLFEQQADARYLVMVADGHARVMRCSPRICVAADDSTLHAALLAADEYLEGQRAMWIIKCAPEVEQSVRALLKELTTPRPPTPPTFQTMTDSGGLN